MYADPADVAERVEATAVAAVKRTHERELKATAARRERFGALVGDRTVRWINRLRIRGLVAAAMSGRSGSGR